MDQNPYGMKIYAPSFKVIFPENPSLQANFMRDVSSVAVDEALNVPAHFRIALHDRLDAESQKFTWLDNESLQPGVKIDLCLGYAQQVSCKGSSQSSDEFYFSGRIRNISPTFESFSSPTMSIEGYDFLQDFHASEKEIPQENVTYSDVVSQIAIKNGLVPGNVEKTTQVFPKIERDENESDFSFVNRLASILGFEFFLRNKNLFFQKPQDKAAAKISFEYGSTIINFTPLLKTSRLANEVKVTGWNKMTKEKVTATAGISDISTSGGFANLDRFISTAQGSRVSTKLEDRVVESAEEAKDLAMAQLKQRNEGFLTGTLEVTGDPRLRPGITIDLKKVGTRFNGRYYVTKALHSVGATGYRTTLEARRCI